MSLFNRLSRRQREEFKSQALVHVAVLTRTALRLCDTRESAEDAVQKTYLQAWKYWENLSTGHELSVMAFSYSLQRDKKEVRRSNATSAN